MGDRNHSSSAISIVRATGADARALSELAFRSKASNGYDDAFMAACRDELAYSAGEVEGEEFWKAIGQEGQLVGMVCLEPDGEDGEVGHFFVAPDAKRMGVGRMLWQHMEARAGALRVRRLHLDADPFAVPFYEAMGMRVVGEAPSGSIPGRMLPRMEKVLQ
jgi:GNAT superfamily N-acetyltransferase